MTQEDLVISKESIKLLKEKSAQIFKFWFTQITFETETEPVEDDLQTNDQDQWIKLSAKEKIDLDKAKVFIKALCNPEIIEIVEIDNNLNKKLNDTYLNTLIQKHQVHFDKILDKNLIVQGKNDNVSNCLIDLKSQNSDVNEKCPKLTVTSATVNKPPSSLMSLEVKPLSSLMSLEVKQPNEIDLTEDELLWIEDMKAFTPDSYSKMSSKSSLNDKKKSPLRNNLKDNKASSIEPVNDESDKRHVIIDASNVAIEHGKELGKGKCFSCKGIRLSVDFFKSRGHTVKAILPRYRRGTADYQNPSINPEILDDLENEGLLTYTPSRRIDNKLIVSYDDRFILKAAEAMGSVIVSNDNYRDLQQENPDWKKLVNESLLQFSFVGDLFMVADDPLGRTGPSLDVFLRKKNRPVFARPNGHCSNQSKQQDRNEINNNNNVKSNKNHYNNNNNNNNNKLSNGGGGGGSSSSIGSNKSNKSNKKCTSQSIPIQDNKSADNDVEGATAFSIDSQSSDQECQMRDEAQSGDLFLSLIEIFTDSGDAISELLREYPDTTDVDFFTQKLLK